MSIRYSLRTLHAEGVLYSIGAPRPYDPRCFQVLDVGCRQNVAQPKASHARAVGACPRGVAEFTKTVAEFTKNALAGQKLLQVSKILLIFVVRLLHTKDINTI